MVWHFYSIPRCLPVLWRLSIEVTNGWCNSALLRLTSWIRPVCSVCCLSDTLMDWWEHRWAIIRTSLVLALPFFPLNFAHYNPDSLSLFPWLVRAIERARLECHWLQQRLCKEMPIKPLAGGRGRRGHDSSLPVLTQGLSHGCMKALSGYRVSVCFLFFQQDGPPPCS